MPDTTPETTLQSTPHTGRHAFLYTTFPDESTARAAARAMVEARVVACANIFPAMRAVYRYQDRIAEAAETAVIFKLPDDRRDAAARLLRQNHPYETPVVAFLDVTADAATAAWLLAETRAPAGG
ncbi:divalent-cation tolerance protein CutA [Camelimonas abortus]|uniref:Divalent-cation tolerance protein CutA n=1 Tax=Camelimonas abortus TaxID=1017184 RepID=A0ABV7LGV3_9HYPH